MFNRQSWETAQDPGHDLPIVAASMPATPTQRKLALIVIAILASVAVLLVPVAAQPAGRLDVFIAVIQTVICVADLLTAVLLFSEYAVERRPAILVLASGYIASGSFAFLQTLAFPGAYGPNGVIGDGLNTPAWLFVLWHTSFPLAVGIYALKKDVVETARPPRSPIARIVMTIGCVLIAIAAFAWIVATFPSHLPILYATSVTQQTLFASNINIFLWLCGFTALVILFTHRRTILGLWLMVTLLAWMPNFLVAIFVTNVRFSVGWYAGRGYALIASCTLLTVLLTSSRSISSLRSVCRLNRFRTPVITSFTRWLALAADATALRASSRLGLAALSQFSAAAQDAAIPASGCLISCAMAEVAASTLISRLARSRRSSTIVFARRACSMIDDVSSTVSSVQLAISA